MAEVAGKQDVLLRMQEELKRSVKKPRAERSLAMVIDLRKCVGCSACTVACVAENHLPPGVVYRPVLEEEIGRYPNASRRFWPRPCMQCENPPCVDVCPVRATYKNPDGVIVVNYDECIGCRYCITACPYGARTFDFGSTYNSGAPQVPGTIVGLQKAVSYETSPNYEYGKAWPRKADASPIGNARKCQFCLHRVNVGMLPACVTTCIGRATFFGDASDRGSLVSELLGSPNITRLKEELGTQPRVYYLV